MNKYKFTNKEILHISIITVIYVTWIISMHVLMAMTGEQDSHIIYTDILGSALALIYTIFLHYPLMPFMSKYINARTEAEAVKIRREYAIRALYCIVLGFFVLAFFLFLKLDNFHEHPVAQSVGVMFFPFAIAAGSFAVFTIKYSKKMRILMYVDKLQHKNADIEG